jgi:hypothetical protein
MDSSITCLLINDSSGETGGYGANANITVEGGVWDCNQSLWSTQCNGFAFGHCNNVHIRNLEIRNTGDRWHCIEINACNSVYVEKCRFIGSYLKNSEAIQIDNAGSDGRWPYFGPFDEYPCTNIHITDNYFEDFGWAIATHSSVNISVGRHSRIFIKSNYGRLLYMGAVNCQNWTGYVIDGNTFQGASNSTVTGDSAIRIVYDQSSNAPNTDFKIVNNALFDWSTNGAFNIRVQGLSTSSSWNEINKGVICNNSLYATGGQHNLSIRYATDIHVDNNSVESPTDTTKRSLLFYQGRRLSATGNTGSGGVELGNTFNESSVHITYVANNFDGTLYVSSTTTYCTIVGNRYTSQSGTASSEAIFSANKTG